jgi:hypothetical protein
MKLVEIATILKNTPRLEKLIDDPEGSGYIQISDALANQMAEEIESWIDPAHYAFDVNFKDWNLH